MNTLRPTAADVTYVITRLEIDEAILEEHKQDEPVRTDDITLGVLFLVAWIILFDSVQAAWKFSVRPPCQ